MPKEVRIDISANANNVNNTLREVETNVDRVNSKVNTVNQTNVTGTSKNLPANQNLDVQNQILLYRQQQKQSEQEIKKKYSELRSGNIAEFQETTHKHKAGTLSDKEYEKESKRYHVSQAQSYEEQRQEITAGEKLIAEKIEALTQRQDEVVRDDTESKQRGGDSKSVGILQGLFEKRSDLMAKRMAATSETELRGLSKQLDKTNKDIQRRGGVSGRGMADTITATGEFAGAMASGNADTMASGAMGLMSKAGPWGVALAAITAAGITAVKTVSSRKESLGELISYRGLGTKNDIESDIEKSESYKYGYKDVGEEIAKRKELLMAGGNIRAGGLNNFYEASMLEKGYGVNSIASLSGNERQDRYAKSTSENIIEMINVLTAIKDSGISKEDFTQLNEKSQLMFRLQSDQKDKQEKFDQNSVIGLMAGFAKLGGSGADDRAGDFISKTVGAMGETTNANKMLLLKKFAIDAHPEFKNDPYEISRIIEENVDPKYHAAVLKGLPEMLGPNKQQLKYGMKTFYGSRNNGGPTADQRDMLLSAGTNPDFLKTILGNNLKKTDAASFGDAKVYAEQKVSDLTVAIDGFKSSIASMLTGEGTIPVTIMNKNLNANQPTIIPINTNGIPGAGDSWYTKGLKLQNTLYNNIFK